MKAIAFIIGSILFVTAAVPAMAQDAYVPPPMFDDSIRPETTTGNIVEPRVSNREGTAPTRANTPTPPAAVVAPAAPSMPAAPKFMQPIVEGQPKPKTDAPAKPVVKATETPKPSKPKTASTVTPPKKPDAPKAVAKTEVSEKKETPAAAPVAEKEAVKPEVAAAPKKAEPAPQPASKVTSKGVVTGPKTMPAVPTHRVEMVDLAAPPEAPAGDEPTILERHQSEVAEQKEAAAPVEVKAADAIAAAQAAGVAPTVFESGAAQNVLKKILPYAPGQTELGEQDLTAIGAGILKELGERDSWRIQIRSFATSQGEGVSSDKRIALSRAIALRHSLVKQGVRASRIDVRAEGQQPAATGLSSDRVDLYLYSPTEKPQVF